MEGLDGFKYVRMKTHILAKIDTYLDNLVV